MFNYDPTAETSPDGQLVDYINEVMSNDNLGDLQVIEQVYEAIEKAYKEEVI
jgi:hypothetical protein